MTRGPVLSSCAGLIFLWDSHTSFLTDLPPSETLSKILYVHKIDELHGKRLDVHEFIFLK